MNHLTFSLEDIMPQTFKYLDDEVLLQLKDYPVEHGEMMNSNRHYLNSEQSVGMNLTEKQFEAVDSGVNFKINKMLLKDKSGYEFSVNYTKDFQPQFLTQKRTARGYLGTMVKTKSIFCFLYIIFNECICDFYINAIFSDWWCLFLILRKNISAFLCKIVSRIANHYFTITRV